MANASCTTTARQHRSAIIFVIVFICERMEERNSTPFQNVSNGAVLTIAVVNMVAPNDVDVVEILKILVNSTTTAAMMHRREATIDSPEPHS